MMKKTPAAFRSSSHFESYPTPSSRSALQAGCCRYTIGGVLDLDNLADRMLKPIFKASGLKWKGWHAYRRASPRTCMNSVFPDIVIQAILRREDIGTPQRSYIKTVPRVVTNAMKRLESQVACTADATKQFGKLKKANQKPT